MVGRLPVFAASAGALIGVFLAFPVEDVRSKCPAAGEGLNYCVVQKSWLPALMTVLLSALVAFLVVEFLIKAPALWRAFRLAQHHRRTAETPPFGNDPTLVDASWGHTYEDPAKPKPVRQDAPRSTPRTKHAERVISPDRDGGLSDDIEMRR